MSEITKNSEEILFVDHKTVESIKAEARQSTRHMARLLMHLNHENPVQEMLIAMGRDCVVTPNCAISESESLQLVEGELLLVVFDQNGKVIQQVEMGSIGSGKPFLYRLSSTPWHTMIPLTEMVVVHETLQGPFKNSSDPLPGWIPTEATSMKRFMDEFVGQAGLD